LRKNALKHNTFGVRDKKGSRVAHSWSGQVRSGQVRSGQVVVSFKIKSV